MDLVPKQNLKSLGRAAIGFLLCLVIWLGISETPWAKQNPQIMWLAHPKEVATKIWDVCFTDASKLETMPRALLKQERDSITGSCKRILPGFLLTFIVGIPAGLLLGYATWFYRLLEGPLDFWRSIPPLAVLPICFFITQGSQPRLWGWISSDDQARIVSIVFGCLPIILFQVADAIRNIPIERRDFANQIQASLFFKLRWLLLFELMPPIFISLRTVVSFSVIIVVAGEMAWGAGNGLGDRIMWTRNAENGLPASYAFAIITGGIGFFINACIRWIEQRVITWK